jgi:hypothetical protein
MMRSRSLLIMLLAMICNTNVRAQADTLSNFAEVKDAEIPKVLLGIQVSPVSSWLTTDDNTISDDGNNAGLRIGILYEKPFSSNYSVAGSFSVATNQGGTLLYEKGGNYLPQSNLSDPDLNTGDKPLPDNTRITYRVNYLEYIGGLRLKTNPIGKKRGWRVFADLPIFGAGISLKSSGDIDGQGINAEDESIGKDLRNILLFWGAGAGVELELQNGMRLVGGIAYTQSITDITRDKGNKAFELLDDKGTSDPLDDEYRIQEDSSRAILKGLTFKIGVIF